MFYYLVSLFLLWMLPASAEPLSLQVEAEAALLMNADTGAILFEKNGYQLMYPASTTKIATVLYALHVRGNKLNTIVAVPQDCIVSITEEAKRRANYSQPSHWLTPDGTHMGLKKGEEMSLRDLLFGIMLVSANDASNVIAHHLGGSVPKFMEGMNAYLKEIGCKNTTFCNPHGLFHPNHQTTAYDMAVMTREALKNPTFCKIVSTVRHMRPKTNMQEAVPLVQSNKLLRPGKFYYPKAIGVKTGYIAKAGHNLVAAARHEGRTLIAVQHKAKERTDLFGDAIKMFEAAFNQPKVQRTLMKGGPQPYALEVAGASKPVKSYLKADVVCSYYPAEEVKLRCRLYWNELAPPIAQHQQVGELRFQDTEGNLVMTAPLLAEETVETTWLYDLKHWLIHLWAAYPLLIVVVLCLLTILLFIYFFR